MKGYYMRTREQILETKKRYRIKNKEKISKYNKTYNLNHKCSDEQARSKVIKRMGLTIEQYDELLTKQEYCCAICGTHQDKLKQKLSIDHNHDTLKIRGLLCNKCNRGIGLLNDSIVQLQKAIDYLNNNN